MHTNPAGRTPHRGSTHETQAAARRLSKSCSSRCTQRLHTLTKTTRMARTGYAHSTQAADRGRRNVDYTCPSCTHTRRSMQHREHSPWVRDQQPLVGRLLSGRRARRQIATRLARTRPESRSTSGLTGGVMREENLEKGMGMGRGGDRWGHTVTNCHKQVPLTHKAAAPPAIPTQQPSQRSHKYH